MTRLIRVLTACAALAIAPLGAVAQSIPYDASFTGVKMRLSNSGSTTVFYSVREDAGRTLVCGFYFSEGANNDAVSQELLRRSRLRADQQTVMQNISHFTRIRPGTRFARVQANCKESRRAWQDSYATVNVSFAPPAGSFN